MTFEVSELARRFAPWSISKLNVAETCGKQFEFKHVLKHEEVLKSTDNQVGLALHKVLELRLRGKLAREAEELALVAHPLTSTEMDLYRSMLDAVDEFLRKLDIFIKQWGHCELLIEHRWGLTVDGRGTAFDAGDVFFRGVLDLGVLTPDHDLIVIDHKAGKPRGLQKYRHQLDGYAVLATANVIGLEGVRAALHYLQETPHMRIQWARYQAAAHISKYLLPGLYDYINVIAQKLRTFEAKPGPRWPCLWCAYRPVCDDYARMNGAAR